MLAILIEADPKLRWVDLIEGVVTKNLQIRAPELDREMFIVRSNRRYSHRETMFATEVLDLFKKRLSCASFNIHRNGSDWDFNISLAHRCLVASHQSAYENRDRYETPRARKHTCHRVGELGLRPRTGSGSVPESRSRI